MKKQDLQNKNLHYLLKQLENETKSNQNYEDIKKLNGFSSLSKIGRLSLSINPFINIFKQNNNYVLKTKKDSFNFTVLSDYNILKKDKKELKDIKKRSNNEIGYTIKTVLSKRLNSPLLHTVVENGNELNTIVEYKKNNTPMIISYKDNIIMKKEDYLKLFNPEFIQTLNEAELARIMYFTKETNVGINMLYPLLFGKEIIQELGKNFPYFIDEYDEDGIHKNNSFLTFEDQFELGNGDVIIGKMDEEIQTFTLKSILLTKNITYSKKKKQYYYKHKYPFRVLSDIVQRPLKDILLSEERYGECHFYSAALINGLEKAELVSGKIKINELDYYNHSWIETENSVIDFNRNLIMKKKDYYNMLKVKIINRSPKEIILKNQQLEKEYQLNLAPIICNYFSQELNRDFEKNKSLLKK